MKKLLFGYRGLAYNVGWACICRFMIAQHPEVEQKVLAELDAHGLLVTPARPNPRPLEWDDLGKLTYTNSCIKVELAPSPPVLMYIVCCGVAPLSCVTCKPEQDRPAPSACGTLSLIHMLFAASRFLVDAVCSACQSAICSACRNLCGWSQR